MIQRDTLLSTPGLRNQNVFELLPKIGVAAQIDLHRDLAAILIGQVVDPGQWMPSAHSDSKPTPHRNGRQGAIAEGLRDANIALLHPPFSAGSGVFP